ncbi:MAG: hypothetical protein Q9166_002626 [cf. Caloplaca sp. 2 TL-2023]
MARELVLITGGTGFVGYSIVVRALHEGYHVRLVIRNDSDVGKIKMAPSCQPHAGNIEFIVVKDMTQEGAFDEAMQDASFVLHVASPTPGPDKDEPFLDTMVQPAILGTTRVLEAAAKVPSVKRVVFTSSVSVVMTEDQGLVHDENTTAPVPDNSYATKDIYAGYHTSKVKAYNTTQDFLRHQNPHFTIINIMLSFVVGKHELLTTPEDIIGPKTSNLVALAPIFGEGMPFPIPGTTVHIDDVAMVHVAALDPKIEGNQDFVLTAGGVEGIRWNDAKEIVRRRFPEAVEKGLLPLQGSTETRVMKVDGGKAERVFGFRYKDFEEQIVSVIGQYLDAVEERHQ